MSVVGEGGEGPLGVAVPSHRLLGVPPAALHGVAGLLVGRVAGFLVGRVAGLLRLLEVRSWALMTSSALSPWCSRSQGPPRARQVMVFMVLSV